MKGETLNFTQLQHKKYKFALFDKEGKKVFGDRLTNKGLLITDKSPLGHLGIYSIKVESFDYKKSINLLKKRLVFGFILSYLLISFVGFYLIKLFMKPLKEARVRLDRFIKDTTHELNTPITAIMMCANEDALKNPKNIKRLYLSSKRLSELYKDLTYIFLEESDTKKKENLKLKDIITDELAYFELLASQKGIKISTHLDETNLMIDREDFKRLFSNLLSNAIKYNNINGKIEITLKNKTLHIKDNGIGISKNEQKRIFDRYYRATTQSGGFGMGLSIVERIIKENGFRFELNSDKSGSEFIIKF